MIQAVWFMPAGCAGEPQGVWPQQLQAGTEGHRAAGCAGQGPLCADGNRWRQELVLPGNTARMGGCLGL